MKKFVAMLLALVMVFALCACGSKTEDGNKDAASIKVSYTYPAHANIQALVASNKNYRMVFKGLNEARSGKPQIVEVYKLSHSPSSLGLIGDDFGAMEFTGKAQKDVTKTGALISQYLQIQDVD